MSVAIAPSPWPAPAVARVGAGWRFAREEAGALSWVLRRNCSISPRQMLAVYLGFCVVSLVIASAFWWVGAPVVVAFAGIEMLALGAALLVFARHATDRETLTLCGQRLAVAHHHGQAVDRTEFRAEWVRVEPVAGEGSLLELSGEGRRARVGRYLPAALRADLARELRTALRGLHPSAR